ncbi:MAG: BrnA antitoxin family protein [Rickettsiales bacterium]|jgi:uncharacterized protein (DUF4415 family)|nr:BrnA antitoxin family protein [Rickettsiales bacterium]
MKKMIRMTAEEIRKNLDVKKAIAMAKAAPEYDGGPDPAGKVVARGFAAFKEYINKNGRPRVDDPKEVVSIRLPASVIKSLRATGRGWRTRAGEYLVDGFRQSGARRAAA